MKHAKLPWKYTYDCDTGINDESFWEFFTIMNDATIPGDEGIGRTEKSEDAEFICRACNNYYNFMELLEAANTLLANALDRNECHDEETGIIFDNWRELVAAIDKCEKR